MIFGAACGGTAPANDDLGNGGGGDLATSPNDNCGSAAAVTLSQDVQPILSKHCSGFECHFNFFSSGHTFANLVNQPAPECKDGRAYVAPGRPSTSYVYQKVTGADLCSGGRMPANGTPLGADEIRVIHDWICAGAPNN